MQWHSFDVREKSFEAQFKSLHAAGRLGVGLESKDPPDMRRDRTSPGSEEMIMPTKLKPSEYPGRRWSDKARRKKYVASLLDELDRLEARSHPSGGASSAKGKDLAAFDALETAGKLVRAVAGWAIDHQAGLALEGLSFVPLQPSQTSQHPQYKEQRDAVDDHRHEHNGANLFHVIEDPSVARKLLVNLLRANPGAFPMELALPVVEAIEGLEFGEQSPFFTPVKSGRKAGLLERRGHLRAIAFIAYRRAKGITKERALEEVAAAFGQSPDTVISWEKRLGDAFNRLEVPRTIAFAENYATHKGTLAEEIYGDDALKVSGKAFQAIKRRRKSHT
jgi:hypothetical protein